MSAAQEKKSLREMMKGAIARVPGGEWEAGAEAVCTRLAASLPAGGAVMLYAAMPGEIDLGALAAVCERRGVAVCLPAVDWASRRMEAAVWERVTGAGGRGGLGAGWRAGRHGVLEPPPGARRIAVEELAMVAAPGLAFDTAGGRLGRGAGFYDRFLALPGLRALKVGVGLDVQVVGRVPRDDWDVPLDAIATPSRWIEVHGPRGRVDAAR